MSKVVNVSPHFVLEPCLVSLDVTFKLLLVRSVLGLLLGFLILLLSLSFQLLLHVLDVSLSLMQNIFGLFLGLIDLLPGFLLLLLQKGNPV
jgi:hypothetical protein